MAFEKTYVHMKTFRIRQKIRGTSTEDDLAVSFLTVSTGEEALNLQLLLLARSISFLQEDADFLME